MITIDECREKSNDLLTTDPLHGCDLFSENQCRVSDLFVSRSRLHYNASEENNKKCNLTEMHLFHRGALDHRFRIACLFIYAAVFFELLFHSLIMHAPHSRRSTNLTHDPILRPLNPVLRQL